MGAVPTAASLAAVRQGLPADPIDATDALVAKVFDPDADTAVAATGEILRRAGIPIVSNAGPMVGLPDDYVIVNQQIPAELLPALTAAVRSGTSYTLDQVAGILQLAQATSSPLTGPELIGLLSQWGKNASDPPEAVVAGSAGRALAAWHGQPLDPATVVGDADLTKAQKDPASVSQQTLAALLNSARVRDLDPLQVVLVLAHLTSAVGEHVTPTVSSPAGLRTDSGSLLPHSATAEGCATFSKGLLGKIEHSKAKGLFRKAVAFAAKQFVTIEKTFSTLDDAAAQAAGNAAAKIVGNAFKAYDVGADVLTTILIEYGVHVDVTRDTADPHFRHQHLDQSKNVDFTATVSFHLDMEGDQGQKVGCWQFIGLDLPKNGPQSGWLVHFSVAGFPLVLRHEPLSEVPENQPTDDAGQVQWEAYPRTEKSPPQPGEQQPVHSVTNDLQVRPDQNVALAKWSDLFTLLTGLGKLTAPTSVLENIGNRYIRDNLLPTTHYPVPVKYHLVEPYTIRSDGFMTIPLYAGIHVDSDLYSCTGPGGPWKGSITFSAKAGAATEAVQKLLGVPGSDGGQFTEQLSFTLDPTSGARQQIHVPTASGDMGMWLTLNTAAIAALGDPTSPASASPVVGDGSWTFGGHDITMLSDMLGPNYSNGLGLSVVATLLDPRCTGSSLTDDTFDQE